jgi:Tol biopolymer transport system component
VGDLDTFATWSPDGTTIAFVSISGNNKGDLYMMNPDGSDLRLIRRNEGATFGGRPAWKPN